MSPHFDEPKLIADAGLLPLVALAERVGLPQLAARVRIEAADHSGGAHAPAKVMSLMGAMCAGADSIDDADRLRHGAMDRAFAGIRAPSTLGTFLRSYSPSVISLAVAGRLTVPRSTATGHASAAPAPPTVNERWARSVYSARANVRAGLQ